MTKKYLIYKSAVILFIALSCLSSSAQEKGEVKLTLSVSDRMLDVKIEVPANDLEKTSFTLSDWGGQSNYAENIYRVAARDKNGGVLKPEKTDARTWTINNRKKAFELNYTVVSQKDSFIGNNTRSYFHPTIFKDYAFLWGMTFLFFPDDEKISALPVRLQINPNEYGKAYTNLPEKVNSFDDLSELFVAAGDYRVTEKTIGERRVKFLLRGKDWKFTDEEFSGTVARIIEAQVKYMGFSASKDDLLITLTEGAPHSKGGTVVRNVISVYPNPQVGLQDFDTLRLIAHEHFHFWNGSLWHDSGGKKEGYYKWMSEGFTEYYAGLTLFRENLITEKQFVGWLNALLLEYQTNTIAPTATAEVLSEKYWESNEYNRLPYVKGALIAFLTDLQIRQMTKDKKQIDDLMRLLMSKTDLKKGYDDKLLLENFTAVTMPEAETNARRFVYSRQLYDDYMLGAKFLPVIEVLKKSSISVAEQPKDVFELGFTTENDKLELGARVKEVKSQSAIDAGLKAGDELRGFSFRYNQPQEPATFTVLRGDETVPIKYYPKKTINILQIDENARIPR